MDRCCEIFFVLPVYDNFVLGSSITPIYLSTITYNDQRCNDDLQRLDKIITFLSNDNCKLYYDKNNAKLYLDSIVDNNNSYPLNIKSNIFRKKILENCIDWNFNSCQKPNEEYSYENYLSIKNDILCEIAKRSMLSKGASNYLLCSDNILHNSDGKTVNIYLNGYKQSFEIIKLNIKDISNWVSEKRIPQRIFSYNPKHGLSGKGSYPESRGNKVSLLECSIEEANRLLKKAIADDLSKKKLYSYDKQRKKYIKFMCEINNKYHGFHLDKDEESKIPDNVREYIEMLLD